MVDERAGERLQKGAAEESAPCLVSAVLMPESADGLTSLAQAQVSEKEEVARPMRAKRGKVRRSGRGPAKRHTPQQAR